MKATNTTSSYTYLLIGSGRVARHLAHYFNLLNISFSSWDRSQDPHALGRKVSQATHILLALSDSALEGFFRQHLAGHDKVFVQFSGAHHFNDMISAHPLMTFGPELYDLDFYQKIHFTLTGCGSLAQALPGLPNGYTVLPAEQKALYHAYCVLGGNFVTLLTAKMISGFADLNIPPEAAKVYSQKIIENTFANPQTALTGPLVRKDASTVNANLNSLINDPYYGVYQAFLKAHWPDYPEK